MAGKFRFRLKASNGQVVATGEAYETKAISVGSEAMYAQQQQGCYPDP